MVDSRTGSARSASSRPSTGDLDHPVPRRQRRQRRLDRRRQVGVQAGRHHQVGRARARPGRTRSGCGGTRRGGAAGGRPPEMRSDADRTPAEHRRRVDRLARRPRRRSPRPSPCPGCPAPGRPPRRRRAARAAAASRPLCTVGRLEVAAERLADGDRAGEQRRAASDSVRENQAGSAPPSVITYATRAPGPRRRAPRPGSPAAPSAGRRSPPACRRGRRRRPVAAAVRRRLLVDGEHDRLQRGVARLDRVARAPVGGSGGSRSGSATTSA